MGQRAVKLKGREGEGEGKPEDKGIYALPINLTKDLKIPKATSILPFFLLFSNMEFSPGLMLELSIFFLWFMRTFREYKVMKVTKPAGFTAK